MAATGAFSISGTVTSLLTGSKTIGPLALTAANAVATTQSVSLAIGANTVTVPSGATAAIIVPDPANTGTLTLKGVTGDTGIPISVTLPFLLAVSTGTFVLTASAVGTVQIVWM